MRSLKVALVHDWLTGLRGGERCLEEFIRIYPNADLYTLIHVPGSTSNLIDERIKRTSFLQKLPLVHKYYRWLLPLYPVAIKSLKIDDCDLVISLSHAAAKNVEIPDGAKHICFCFTPMRYIWDQAESYFGFLRYFLFPIIYCLRIWDRSGSKGVDRFVAISRFVAARIRSFYQIRSNVIYPPIADYWLERIEINQNTQAYLYAGALVPYKNVEEIIHAFNQLNQPLVIAGDGPLKEKLQSLAKSNIRFLGRVSDRELHKLYANSKALIFAAREDFGLTPIECLAAGTPVIAPFCGALKESLNNLKYWKVKQENQQNITGVFYRYDLDDLVSEIKQGVMFFEEIESEIDRQNCFRHARQFSVDSFRKQWFDLLKSMRLEEANA